MSKMLLVSIAFLTALVIFSCSGNHTPVATDLAGVNQSQGTPVSSADDNSVKSYPGLFGAWKVHIDPETLTADIIPARNAGAIGNIFDADLSQFLTVSPCINCLRIPGIILDGYDDLEIRIQMKHPFADITKRPDLHGFDVRAIFIAEQNNPVTFDEIKVMKPDGTEESAQINAMYDGLLNADGYTSHFDSIVNDDRYFPGGVDVPGNLNPYLRFFESYTTGTFDPAHPTGHNVMAVGAGYYERVAVFDKAVLQNGLTFYVIADVAYGQSAVFSNRTNPQYYIPAFNRTEPWRVEYWLENNTLDWTDPTSSADVVVQVFDWQQGFSVDLAYPNPSNLAGLPESSNVQQVELSVPDLMDGPLTLTTPESGTGTPTDPLQYRFTISNSKSSWGDVFGLIAVRDELYGHASPSGRMPIPSSPAGFPYETEDIRDYAVYYPIFVYFQHPNGTFFYTYNNINHELYVPVVEYLAQYAPTPSTTLHPFYYSDMSHKKYQYKWDLDYDGVTFDLDASGLPSPKIQFTEGGQHNIGLRVRTNSKPTHETIYTIPVYGEGIGYTKSPFTGGATSSTTGQQGKHSVAATSDKFYAVTTREISNNREIWLSTFDRFGNTTSEQVTSEANPSFDPSIWVIESGTSTDFYITFVEYDGVSNQVYFTKKIAGGTFTIPEKIVNWTNNENRPIIVYFNNKLFIYYIITSLGNQEAIQVVYSDNYGDTWAGDSSAVYMSSDHQTDHTVAMNTWGQIFLVWTDDLNNATSGTDLYTAASWNGTSFSGKRCISTIQGKVNEYASSIVCGSEEIAIAYLAQTQGNSKSYAHLKIIHTSHDSVADYSLETYDLNGNQTFTRPCIAYSGPGIYLMSYGIYDLVAHTLDVHLEKLVGTPWQGRFQEYNIFQKSAGIVDSANSGGQIFPCMTSYKPVYTVAEGFLLYRQFNDGYVTSGSDPKMVFGDLEADYFVADGYHGW